VNDPQVGASNALRTLDVSSSTSRQFSEELRLQSSFKGPINFSGGVNFVSFKTRSDYYVLSNGLTGPVESLAALKDVGYPLDFGANPDGSGANYYDNRTDYRLGAYAAFGELYYKPTDDLKFTAGLRYGVDRKWDVGYGVKLLATPPYDATPQTVAFKEWTGRLNAEWTPHFSFTDKTLVYATYSRGYKPGGFNPAQSVGLGVNASFNPEFVDAIEIGTKNAILGGSMILNANVFHYDYTGYQISAIVNRNSVNSNIDAKVDGAEVEAIWEPIHRLRINGTLGYLHTDISNGSVADQLDLTGGDPSLTVVKDLTASNCTVKTADLAKIQGLINAKAAGDATATAVLKGVMGYLTDPDNKTKWPGIFPSENYLMTCSGVAAATGMFPKFTGGAITLSGYGQTGGVNVNLKGHELPNSPEVTINIGAQYEYHLGENWRITPRVDIYHQDTSYTRIFNTVHDQLKAYEVVNLSVLVQEPDWGLNIQAYVKNVFDKNYIQDSYLTDASSGLFTNIFIGDPRTYGVAVTKKF
jgi:outer membrane receptor protein involved in Fe transport